MSGSRSACRTGMTSSASCPLAIPLARSRGSRSASRSRTWRRPNGTASPCRSAESTDKQRAPRARGSLGSEDPDRLRGRALRLAGVDRRHDSPPLTHPEVDLKGERNEDHEGRNAEPDGGVERVGADRPPAVSVQQQTAKRLTAEEGLNLAGELGVGRIRLRLGADLRIGLAAGDLTQVDADEVIRVDLGLGTGRELLPTVLVHRCLLVSRQGRNRRAVRRREVDLLRRELGLDLVGNEGIAPEQESRAKAQDADQADLEHDDSPPNRRCHINHLLKISASWISPGLDTILTAGGDSAQDQWS